MRLFGIRFTTTTVACEQFCLTRCLAHDAAFVRDPWQSVAVHCRWRCACDLAEILTDCTGEPRLAVRLAQHCCMLCCCTDSVCQCDSLATDVNTVFAMLGRSNIVCWKARQQSHRPHRTVRQYCCANTTVTTLCKLS
jgi:hypothetical protein